MRIPRPLSVSMLAALPILVAVAAPGQAAEPCSPAEAVSMATPDPVSTARIPAPHGREFLQLHARRTGTQIIVQTLGADGTPLGRTETLAGLAETPLYLRRGDGLCRLTLRWQTPADQARNDSSPADTPERRQTP